MRIRLRDYQQECHDAVLSSWGEKPWCDLIKEEGEGKGPFRSVIANLFTAAGKTIIAGAIINTMHHAGRCLFVADTDELCRQPARSFKDNLGLYADTEKADKKASMMSTIVVGSAQTMCRENRLLRYNQNHFSYIFVDEAHRGSDRNKKITDYFETAKVCGITATAFRAKTRDLSAWFDHVAFEMGMLEAMEQAYIVPIRVLTLPVRVDASEIHQKGGDYDQREVAEKIEPFYEAIAELIKEHAKDRQLLVFNPLISSSRKFTEICIRAGIKAKHVDGQSPDRHQIQEEFAERRFQVLSNSQLLGTGWDCPPCDGLLNLSLTRSELTFRQRAGRILRPLPGTIDGIDDKDERKARIAASAKPDALILDLLYHTARFSLSGPVDLVAANTEDRAAIQKKLELGAERDLGEVASEVQADRERTLKEALERAATQRATIFRTYIDAGYVGIALHSRTLIDYEPEARWHEEPPTEKQIEFLSKHGINPETIKDRGHASKITDAIFGRSKARLCGIRAVVALEKLGVLDASSCTDQRAYEILGQDMPFPFGRPAAMGQTFRKVPFSYWQWLSSQQWVNKGTQPAIWSHMKSLGLVDAKPFQATAKPASDPLVPLSFGGAGTKAEEEEEDEVPF